MIETNNNIAKGPDHVGIIIEVKEDGSFVASEGNTNEKITMVERPVKEYTYVKSGEFWQRKGCLGDTCKVHMFCSVKLPN